jgi:hypothetical protein
LLIDKNINKLVLNYDNLVSNTEETISKICKKINIEYSIYQNKFKPLIEKISNFKPKQKKLNIEHSDLLNYIKEINKFTENYKW